eukprot:1068839-Pelagomonas_calceolata.AAC.1
MSEGVGVTFDKAGRTEEMYVGSRSSGMLFPLMFCYVCQSKEVAVLPLSSSAYVFLPGNFGERLPGKMMTRLG